MTNRPAVVHLDSFGLIGHNCQTESLLMNMIEYIEGHVVYDNPLALVRSRHGCFPGIIQLRSGELLGLIVIGEAFEAANSSTYVTRSSDRGKTWQLQGPLYDKSKDAIPTSDFLKPLALQDDSLIAVGYRFHRRDPDQPILDPQTGAWLPGDDIVSFSRDDGRTWTTPQVMTRTIPELLEIPGRCLQLHSGDIVNTAGLLPLVDGTNPSGHFGVLVRSRDGGKTWDDHTRYFTTPDLSVSAFEANVCEMQPGRLVAIAWAIDAKTSKSLPNHVTVSHDNGHTWSAPINTGHPGQSANVMYLGGDRLLSIHCQRSQDIGLYVRVIDFSNDRWRVMEEKVIWGGLAGEGAGTNQGFVSLLKTIRFGQASLLPLDNGEILATHWSIEDGQGKVRTHRLRVT